MKHNKNYFIIPHFPPHSDTMLIHQATIMYPRIRNLFYWFLKFNSRIMKKYKLNERSTTLSNFHEGCLLSRVLQAGILLQGDYFLRPPRPARVKRSFLRILNAIQPWKSLLLLFFGRNLFLEGRPFSLKSPKILIFECF